MGLEEEISNALGSLFKDRSTLGILLILSFIGMFINHFISLGWLGYISWFVFIICFSVWFAYNVLNFKRNH